MSIPRNLSVLATSINASGILGIAAGGTGATTASSALTALGAYAANNPSGYTSNLGTVTSVTATAPVVSSGGATPVLSMAAATTSVPGYLTAADWNTFNGKQSALGFTPYNSTNPSGYITSSGSITGNAATATTATTAQKTPLVSVDNSMLFGRSGLQYVNTSNLAGDDATTTNTPTADWWHIIRGNFANLNGFYTDLALPMTAATNIRYRRVSAGVSSGWITVLDSTNYSSYTPTLTGGSASGTWGISITGNAANVTGTVAIANGGTGATTAAAARTALGAGTVTSVATGTGLTGGTITTTGTISLANTAVTAGSYTTANITVDAQGRITAATSGSAGGSYLPLSGGAMTGSTTIGTSNYIRFGPNPTWSSTLQVGGDGTNGITRTATLASVVTTNGNLHLDSGSDKAVYLNFYSGTGGMIFGNGAAGQIGSITAAGALTMNGSITAYSDERLKKDWRLLPFDFVQQLSLVKVGTYTRTDSNERQIGVSAQSLQNLMPEAVIDGEYLSVAYGNAALASAVELAKEVVSLNARIARLEALVSKLIEG